MPSRAEDVTLEEITVTARRREENLMEIPVAVAVVNAAAIEAAGIKDMQKLSLYTPGLHIDTGLTNLSTRTITFRGLSVIGGVASAPATVFVDGVSLAGNGQPYLGDLDRVEVLVGPQSVYFGRATFTGAVNFVTKKPSDTFKGRLAAEYASYDTTDLAVTLEGPVVPGKLSARITGRGYSTAGQWKNYSDPSQRMGWRDTRSILSSIYFTPSEDLTFKVFYDHEYDDSGAPPAIALKGNSLPQFGGTGTQIPGVTGGSQEIFCPTNGTFGVYYCGALPNASQISPRIISGNFDLTPYLQDIFFNNRLGVPMHFDPRFMTHYGSKVVADMVHLNIDYERNGWTFSSVSAYHDTKSQNINTPNYRDTRDVPNPQFNVAVPAGQPCCRLPYISFHLMNQNVNKDYNQEVRITSPQSARLRGVAGASYLKQTSPGLTNFGQSKSVPQYQGSLTAINSSTPAIFAGLYYDIVKDLTLTAEARYQWDKVTATNTFPTRGIPLTDEYKNFSPRISLDYKYAPGSLLYALYSRGYRRGGFNSILVGQPASVLAQLAPIGAGERFGQEKLDNWEIGLKSTWLDNRVRTSLVGYYQVWSNGQVPSTISFVQPNGGVVNTTITTNAGKVDLWGIEAQGDMAVTRKFTVNATFNWQPSKIKAYNYIPQGLQIRRSANVNGNKFFGAPQLKATISPSYTDHFVGDWDWFGRGDWRWRGKYYVDATNLAWIPPSHVVDLHFGLRRDNLSIEGYILNLLDDRNFLQGEYGADSSSSTGGSIENEVRLLLPNKRTVGIKAIYTF
jgi:iron complex outermembrane receptor protein